jgi:hypothetical protein
MHRSKYHPYSITSSARASADFMRPTRPLRLATGFYFK